MGKERKPPILLEMFVWYNIKVYLLVDLLTRTTKLAKNGNPKKARDGRRQPSLAKLV
jgi:hypothetical protein